MPEAIAQQGLPHDFRLSWVSTRKAGPAADGLAANIVGCYLLHELLASVKLPLDELSSAHLVAIEVPPVDLKGFEHNILHLVAKIRAIGPHVAVIVQPSLRRQTQQALWIPVEQDGQATISTHSDVFLQVGKRVSGMPLSDVSWINIWGSVRAVVLTGTDPWSSVIDTTERAKWGFVSTIPFFCPLTDTPRHRPKC